MSYPQDCLNCRQIPARCECAAERSRWMRENAEGMYAALRDLMADAPSERGWWTAQQRRAQKLLDAAPAKAL